MTKGAHLLLVLLLYAAVSGCCTAVPKRNANLVHVVLFSFPGGLPQSRVREFYEDMNRLLTELPQVETWYIGTPAPTRSPERPFVDDNYDVAITATFAGQKRLEDYLLHPNHVAFTRKWESVYEARVFDFYLRS